MAYKCVAKADEDETGLCSVMLYFEGSDKNAFTLLDVLPGRLEKLQEALATNQNFAYYEGEGTVNGHRAFDLVGDQIQVKLASFGGYACSCGDMGFALDRSIYGPLLAAELQRLLMG